MARFFSQSNVHNFLWALLGAGIAALCGVIFKFFTGPDEVKVVNGKFDGRDTIINIIQFAPAAIAKTASSDSLRRKSSITNIPSVSSNIEELELAVPSRPVLNKPTSTKGYSQRPLDSYALVTISKKVFGRDQFIELYISFLREETLLEITPIFAMVLEKESAHSYNQVWIDQFKPAGMKSKIKFSANLKPGSYQLSVGFYFKDQLKGDFPPFYQKQFIISVV